MKKFFSTAILVSTFAVAGLAFAEGTGGTPATAGGTAAPNTVSDAANKPAVTAKPEVKGEGVPAAAKDEKKMAKKSYKDLKKECTDKDASLKGKDLQKCIKEMKKNAA